MRTLRKFLFGVFLVVAPTAEAQANREVRIEGVHQVVEATTAVVARSVAFENAQTVAIARAFDRLGLEPRNLTRRERLAAVSYIQVADERIGPRRYEADFTIGIVRGVLLGDLPLPVNRAPGLPEWVLVVPAVRDGDRATLWDIRGRWAKAWRNDAAHGVVWVTTPPDDEDRARLSLGALAREGAGVLRDIAQKYAAPAVVVVALDRGRAERVSVVAIAWSETHGRHDLGFVLNPPVPPLSGFEALRTQIQDDLARKWSVRRAGLEVTLEFPAESSTAARERRAKLAAVPGLQVIAHARTGSVVTVRISYDGTRSDLLAALRDRGYLSDETAG